MYYGSDSPFINANGPFPSPNNSVGVVVTAPTLSAADKGTPTAVGTNGANVSSDVGNGTLYWVVVSNLGTCTDAQLKAASGGNILQGSRQAVSGTGTQTIANIVGLVTATTYQIIFLQTSAGGADSAQASVSFTTT